MADLSLTSLLQRAQSGDSDARNTLWELVITDVKRLASIAALNESPNAAFQPSVLVSDLYIKLEGSPPTAWTSRKQFFGIVARALDQLLIDHARAVRAQKRGGGAMEESLDLLVAPDAGAGGVQIDNADYRVWILEAMADLQVEAPEAADAFRLRVLFGLSREQTAAALEMTVISVQNRLRYARAFFANRLKRDRGGVEGMGGLVA